MELCKKESSSKLAFKACNIIYCGWFVAHIFRVYTRNSNNNSQQQRKEKSAPNGERNEARHLCECTQRREANKQTTRREKTPHTHTRSARERNKESIKCVLSKMQERALMKRHRTRGAISMSQTTMNKWNS